MELLSIRIDGYANLDNLSLELGKFNALIALNNFGKSNVIKSLEFGIDFIRLPQSEKKEMMAYMPVIPINKQLANRPFVFEVEFATKVKKEEFLVNYGYSFDWAKNDKSKGQRIRSEFLRVKQRKSDTKYKTYIERNLKESFYLSSLTGRCDKQISAEKDELLINKLKSFDDLFYYELIRIINEITIIQADTLTDPDRLFRTIGPEITRTGYSLAVPKISDMGFFIYSLMQKEKATFELFKDSVKSLLPSIEDFEAIEIDLKKHSKIKDDVDLPLDFPEKIYDIAVKEKNNNQKTTIGRISSGSQKLFFILAMAIAAEINEIPLITFEEVENSIHPGLLQKLLIAIEGLTSKTKIIITSHSPYLIKYLEIEKIRIGVPNVNGTAEFKQIKRTKVAKLAKMASEDGMSIGDIIFDGMIECANGETELFNEICA